ncbi:hypothetical protein FNV43_RR05128 [Rhamnella rubrinervis]|uniref:Ubiquitin fusion degradaton protein n=1 Tax=Rhamnella rubrinervis TaxID=2594499 RepID=A0A8K0HN49_9ROSA|nr:hypothetical protein FNV43_RR05128 [Rhamnella rubrinervis]
MDYDYEYSPPHSTFKQMYRCYSASIVQKPHLEKGDKIIMPPSALGRLVFLQIDYPMLFELNNPTAGRVTHCGVLEFVADEGLIYLPDWMMDHMLLQDGEIVEVKNTSLVKGTNVKLQPHTSDFLDISNPKAILETALRSYTCLTTGDTVLVSYNNKKYYINVIETKPSSAVSIVETDCEVDFAPPLDYKEPEKPASTLSNKALVEEEPTSKKAKLSPFTGSGRRLNGTTSTQSVVPASSSILKQHQPDFKNGSRITKSHIERQHPGKLGKLVFGSHAKQPSDQIPKAALNSSSQEPTQQKEQPKFQAFTGRKYSLRD